MRLPVQIAFTLLAAVSPGLHAETPVERPTIPVLYGSHHHGIDMPVAKKMVAAGQKAYRRGKTDMAIKAYELALSLGDTRGAVGLALLHEQSGRSALARSYLSQAFNLDVDVEGILSTMQAAAPKHAAVSTLLNWYRSAYQVVGTSTRPSTLD